ncbi:MAG: glutamine--tRNA ligase/YqeY domain fusion protein [Thermoplasmata archaeon]|nr:glutamine--tRNA ligase/YqeY domain fusion protein [Thermoplasmata archaeon]
MEESQSRDFIRQVIDEDNKTGKYDGRVHTRFPPEPNGYLHIGSAKAIWVNYGIAHEYGGKFNLRFDDTNPIAEEKEFIDAIVEDVKWLGADFEDRLLYSSDYFQQMYDYAIDLIKKGKAYVCDLSAEEMKEYRGDYTTPGRNSPSRERPVEESLDLFVRMKTGEFPDGSKTLRAKIDMAHPNMNMRDPPMYRILHATHPHTGDEWCIYPIYDWAHGLEDSIEGITHSLCSIEFENHRLLYDWFLDELDIYHPQQIEFARMNVSFTVMSKRYLKELVEGDHVNGWDDPRMPTIAGMRRRGYTPTSIREFCNRAGIAKKPNTIAFELLEACVRDDLNKIAPRFMGVLDPLKVVITNFPEGDSEVLEAINNPEDPDAGTRTIPFTRELFIERTDFMEEPFKKFYRLAPGREVRFRYAYFVTCNEVIKDDNGEVVELRCTIDPATKGGDSPDGRKVKGTIHWVSADHAVDAEVMLYDRLFTVEDPMGHPDKPFTEFLNPDSLKALGHCKVEPAIADLPKGAGFQFERTGYFNIDKDSAPDKLVLNRTVPLRDSWARIQKGR